MTDTISCRNYHAHQLLHRRLDGRWVCPVCDAEWVPACLREPNEVYEYLQGLFGCAECLPEFRAEREAEGRCNERTRPNRPGHPFARPGGSDSRQLGTLDPRLATGTPTKRTSTTGAVR